MMIWDDNNASLSFKTSNGVKQGDPLSPILFALFLNDLHDALKSGINVTGNRVRLLMFADDLVLICDNALSLPKIIKSFELYCDSWSMEVNLSKSKIMIFSKSSRFKNDFRWKFKEETIEVVKSYRYLGILLKSNLDFGNLRRKNIMC